MRVLTPTLAALGLSLLAGQSALAQNTGSAGLAQFQAGYNASRYTTAQTTTGTTRDANGNRLVVNGLIQNGASSYSSATAGVGSAAGGRTTLGGSTAIGNSLNVVVQGNNNTVVVNSNQTNTGNVQAGTTLNGNLDL
ncbi:holdfast anchoring protein HfaA [Brevundimonas vesicularis]|uniref:holdfast anchoring protein HfaA n=1 Tax=Brevundimonas vesicularis TaxID=41276 RepID=UPI0038D43274